MENRLIELETRLAFQDDAWQALNTVVVRQSLPRTMIGKLDRKALREEEMAGV